MSVPTPHDQITRIGLRLAKYRREKYSRDQRDFYEQFFLEKHIHQSKYDLRARLRREAVKRALDEVGIPDRPRIVDVGCGVGDVIESMPACAIKIGLAYSQADLDLARRVCSEGVQFVKASALELPFASESVDALICLEVIEHLPDDRAVVSELSRVLKPRGRLLISVPGNHYFAEYLDLMGHYRHYSRESLASLLSSEHLRIIRYVDPYRLINTLHFYPHALLEVTHRILNKCGLPAESLYVRPYLGRFYSQIAELLARQARARKQASLAVSEGSTFVLAERVAGADA
jgi:2-polyprenyl-3-methyl-5-hydroxy-6-metoxy-1,4-benzoquinol methylase